MGACEWNEDTSDEERENNVYDKNLQLAYDKGKASTIRSLHEIPQKKIIMLCIQDEKCQKFEISHPKMCLQQSSVEDIHITDYLLLGYSHFS